MKTSDQFSKTVRFFKKNLKEVFYVRRKRMKKGLHGWCEYQDGIYYITVSKNLSYSEQINCLIHELGHIGSLLKDKEPHGEAFGIQYSKIYKMWEAEFT